MSTSPTPTMKVSPRTFWVGMIVGLLSLSVTINMIVVIFFAGSPSETLEENWEQRSADWNAIQRQATVNRELGWKIKVQDWKDVELAGQLVLLLRDGQDTPLDGAQVQYMTYHLAHPDQISKGDALPGPAGTYLLPDLSLREGYHEFRVDLTLGEQRFTRTWKEYYTPAPPSHPE